MLCAVYKCFVLFIVFVISFSLVKTDSFPDKTNLSEPDPFSLKYDFMVRQKVLLSIMSLNFKCCSKFPKIGDILMAILRAVSAMAITQCQSRGPKYLSTSKISFLRQ